MRIRNLYLFDLLLCSALCHITHVEKKNQTGMYNAYYTHLNTIRRVVRCKNNRYTIDRCEWKRLRQNSSRVASQWFFYHLTKIGFCFIFTSSGPFNTRTGRISGNPFLAGPYIIKRKYCPNFILIASAVPVGRWRMLQSVSQ